MHFVPRDLLSYENHKFEIYQLPEPQRVCMAFIVVVLLFEVYMNWNSYLNQTV